MRFAKKIDWTPPFTPLTLLFFWICIIAAGLVVQLFEGRKTSRFRSINDFKGCRRLKASELCIPAGGAAEGFWQEAVAYPRSERARDCPDDQPVWIKSDGDRDPYEESVRMAATNEPGSCKYVLAATSTLKNFARGDYCGDITLVGDGFYNINAGFVLPKGSRFTDALSRETLKLHQQNLLQSPIDIANQLQCNYENERTTQLDWSLLGIFFYVSWIGLLVLLLLMILSPEPFSKQNSDDGDGDGSDSSGDMA